MWLSAVTAFVPFGFIVPFLDLLCLDLLCWNKLPAFTSYGNFGGRGMLLENCFGSVSRHWFLYLECPSLVLVPN